jgi:mRNA interferase HigB
MRVISKKTIKDFYEQPIYAEGKDSLESWYKEAINATWNNPNEIKEQYCNASVVGNNRIVFNIYGNKYRLIVKINYYAKVIYIRFIGTHKQYDKINAQEI